MRSRGFTLVEVMVALAVVAIALPALMFSLSRQADDTAYLRDKSLAQIVAANRMAELRLQVLSTSELKKGKAFGQAHLAGRDWYWRQEIKNTTDEGFYRVELAIAQEEDPAAPALYTLESFMSEQRALELAKTVASGGFNPVVGAAVEGGGGVDRGDPPPDATPVAKGKEVVDE